MAFSCILICLFIVCVLFSAAKCEPDYPSSPTIKLPQGDLVGNVRRVKGLDDAEVFEYLGIPYAQPPVGELRFKPPLPHTGWQGLLQAKNFGKVCYQDMDHPMLANAAYTNDSVSEDCLTINVYTSSVQGSKPVLVFIHGGGLILGMSDLCDGTAMAAYEDIVVVAMNYRLGTFGFLATGDSELPANLGMRDQQEALRWIQKNIHYFGGDPNQVTLSGESAGGWSVNFHLLSPLSRGLFHRAAPFSGSITFPNSVIQNPMTLARKFGKRVDCPQEKSQDLVTCLRNLPADKINKALVNLHDSEVFTGIVQDQDSLPGDPMALMESGSFNRVPLLNVMCSHEGPMLMLFLYSDVWFNNNLTYAATKKMVRDLLRRQFEGDLDEAVDEVLEFYITKGSQRDKPEYLLKRFTEILSEYLFEAPITQLSRLHQEYAPTYMGVFSYRASFVLWPAWVTGASHSDEQAFVWGLPFLDPIPFIFFPISKFTATDEKVARLTMKYVAKFVKTGNPNDGELPTWPTYSLDDEDYLDIRAHPMAGSSFRKHATAFWLKLTTRLSRGWNTQAKHDEL